MKHVINRNLTSAIFRLGLVILLTFSSSILAQEGDPKNGKSLFNTHCAACHKLDKPMTGPALRNVEARLSKDEGLDRKWLYQWIKNNSSLINAGDAYALKIKDYAPTAMNAFALSNEEIDDILAYTAVDPCVLNPQSSPDCPGYVKPPVEEGDGGGDSASNKIILGALALLFGLLAVALVLVNRTLKRFADEKGVQVPVKEKGTSIWKAFAQNQFLILVTVIIFLLSSAYFAYGALMSVGVDQGYQPVQPIHYSHRIHAGDNEIDCKYCHSSARVSKTSGIPSLNVCMNCHKSIGEVAPETLAEGQAYGVDYNAEIQKLYKAVGWNEADQKYTGTASPVKWIRIHNLPDFAYFNHSQHVSVAGLECQTCHGPVEEMEIMYQHAPLTMGWCINCHRETNVKVIDNEYYTKIHEQLSKKYGVEQLTAAQMGGLECGKCHY